MHCGYLLCSRYTMTKSSAVLFILIFSLIFKLEELVSPTLSLCGRTLLAPCLWNAFLGEGT